MTASRLLRLEIDGRPATAELLAYPALSNYGHFTMMQVRGCRVRGLAAHLARLDAANRELFGVGLDGERVRRAVRHALGIGGSAGEAIADATVRVHVFQPGAGAQPAVMVAVRGPAEVASTPARLRTVAYQRPAAHLKHAGTFGLIYHGEQAERDGYDDALFIGPDGAISESTIANIGCFDGSALVWPDAPVLPGITMLLLDAAARSAGVPVRRQPLRVEDLAAFRAVFLSNSLGLAPVAAVDGHAVPTDPASISTLTDLYTSTPWDDF